MAKYSISLTQYQATFMNMALQLKDRAKALRQELYALYLAMRDPRTPWYARAITATVVGYAFSPIDFIPDFIPILGYLDDLILVPLGIYVALKLIPEDIMHECRAQAASRKHQEKPVIHVAGVIIVLVWLHIALLLILKFFPNFWEG